ncbi:bacteriohemerythrin [Pseudaeromonas pectinilytica]
MNQDRLSNRRQRHNLLRRRRGGWLPLVSLLIGVPWAWARESSAQTNSQTTTTLANCFSLPSGILLLYSVLLTVAGLLLLYLIRKLRQERSARLTLRNEVAENERHFRFIAENSADVIWTMDLATRRLTYISPSVLALRGFTAAEVMQQNLVDWMTVESAERVLASLEDSMIRWNAGDRRDTKRTLAIEQPHKDGHLIHTEVVTTLHANDEGELVSVLGVTRDISERKASEAMMHNLAFYDALTKLPNRRLLQDRLQQAMITAHREQQKMALLFIDLDHFKPVNDQYGHQTGDWLLKMVARRMLNSVRESDTVARMGGDEFVVLLPGPIEKEQVLPIAEKIHARLNQSFETSDGTLLSIACCIGIALYPEHGKTQKQLLKHGDQAMYQAKESGRNQIRFFTPVLARSELDQPDSQHHQLVRLHWKNSYECGTTAIDEEHRQLFELANALLNAELEQQHATDSIQDSLAELLAHTVEHFHHEEELLAAIDYPELESHRLEHQRLLEQAAALNEAAASEELPFTNLLDFVVQEVILTHMFKYDRRYYPFLHSAHDPSSEPTPLDADKAS